MKYIGLTTGQLKCALNFTRIEKRRELSHALVSLPTQCNIICTKQKKGNDKLLDKWVTVHFKVWWCEAVWCISCERSLLAEVICFIKFKTHFTEPVVSPMYFINYY